MKQISVGKSKKKIDISEQNTSDCIIEGSRIIDIQVFARYMWCEFCKQDLSLNNIEQELRKGLGSVFEVRCRNCLLINDVPTGEVCTAENGEKLFDINSKAVLGVLYTGGGHATMSKFLATMDIPCTTSETFKIYERKVGPIIEMIAKESCKEVAEKERALIIQNKENLEALLPEDLRSNGFLVPKTNISNGNEETTVQSELVNEANENYQEKVRLLAAFDMGRSERGNGRQYDSLNGYSGIIGPLIGSVLDFTTRNRKCRKCDKGYSKENHDCRLNFVGSAKAMEADAAAELGTRSSVLKDVNVEVGIFIGDNDICSISAVRNASSHEIIKHSDKNHISKGVKNLLYKINKSKDIDIDNEMNSEAISYFHRCFTYAMAQNQGNLTDMQRAIRNIPSHAFNNHNQCGEWCGYVKDQKNYEHKTVSGGFKNDVLFEHLQKVFNDLANNANTYFTGTSSQANESLNSICYSLSESSDYRFACVVAQKNFKESYIGKAISKLQLKSSSRLSKHIIRTERTSKLKALQAKSVKFKARRRILQKYRMQLRNKKEKTEGVQYESHMGLINVPQSTITKQNNDLHNVNVEEPKMIQDFEDSFKNRDAAIVFFDLETSSLSMSCEILQIAMKCNGILLNEYIYPKQAIPSKVSEVNGLSNIDGQLFLHGKMVPSTPLKLVLLRTLEFLCQFKKPCILVTHNCSFDASRLVKKIKECNLENEFQIIINSFVDTLPLFKKKFPNRKSKGALKSTTLAADLLSLRIESAHDASYDIFMLEQNYVS